jgi:hypothetical protein
MAMFLLGLGAMGATGAYLSSMERPAKKGVPEFNGIWKYQEQQDVDRWLDIVGVEYSTDLVTGLPVAELTNSAGGTKKLWLHDGVEIPEWKPVY